MPQEATPAVDPSMMQKLEAIVSKVAAAQHAGTDPHFGTTVTGTPGMVASPVGAPAPPQNAVPTTPGGIGVSTIPPNRRGEAAAVIQQQHGLTPNPSVPMPLPSSSGFAFPDAKAAKAATMHDAISNITGVVNAVKQQRDQKLERRASIVFNSLHDAIGRGDNETIAKMLDPETAEGKANMKVLEKAGIGVPPEVDMKKQKPPTLEEQAMNKALGAKVDQGKPGISATPDPAQAAQAQQQQSTLEHTQGMAHQAESGAKYNEARTKESEEILKNQQRIVELSTNIPKNETPEEKAAREREIAVRKEIHGVMQPGHTASMIQQKQDEWDAGQTGQTPKYPGYGAGIFERERFDREMKEKLKDKSPFNMILDSVAKTRGLKDKSELPAEQIFQSMQDWEKLKYAATNPARLAHEQTMASFHNALQTGQIDHRAAVELMTNRAKEYDKQIDGMTTTRAALNGYLKRMQEGKPVDIGTMRTTIGKVSTSYATDKGITGIIEKALGGNKIDEEQLSGAIAALDEAIPQLRGQRKEIGEAAQAKPTASGDPVEKLLNSYGVSGVK